MRIGAFDIREPVPALTRPRVFALIPHWADAGACANLAFSYLEKHCGAEHLARLLRPGEFFDFTRYRPTLSRVENAGEIIIPNASIACGHCADSDYLFLRLPEPHAHAEAYIEAVVELLKSFEVNRYTLIGSVFDMVPYTRPPLVTGNGSNEGLKNSLMAAGVVESDYEGPTTIMGLLDQQLAQLGVETVRLFVHVHGYLSPAEDHRGEVRLLEVLGALYNFPVPVEDSIKAKEEQEQISQAAEEFLKQQPQLEIVLKQLEANYDAKVNQGREEIKLSPEVEKFLQDLGGKLGMN